MADSSHGGDWAGDAAIQDRDDGAMALLIGLGAPDDGPPESETRPVDKGSELDHAGAANSRGQTGEPKTMSVSLHHVAIWEAANYDPDAVQDIVSNGIIRYPRIGSLSYFDSQLRDHHDRLRQARATAIPPRPPPPTPAEIGAMWDKRVARFMAEPNSWNNLSWGSRPDTWDCKAPAHVLLKHGFDPERFNRPRPLLPLRPATAKAGG